jgi:phospholipid/cholesterol/gamma-HCH transport system substrate-binding protein
MDERVLQLRVGLMFLATLLIMAILLVLFGKLPRWVGQYPIRVQFEYAGGVTSGTPVRKSGVLIGQVSDVQLTDHDEKVLVTLEIYADKSIYQNEECYVTRDLLGDSAIAFIPSSRIASRERIAPGSILQGRVSDDPTGLKQALESPINTVRSTGEALTSAAKKLEVAADRVGAIFDPATQENVQSVLKSAATSLKAIESVLGDEQNRSKLTESVRKLPDTLDSMNATFRSTDETLRQFTERSKTDGKTAIERMVETIEMTERVLRKFSQPAREGELAPADQIASAMENINEVTNLLRTVTARIDQGEGSLGALIKDRQLYDRLNRAAKNIEDVSWRLKPIVEDARVFMDKAARHPGVIVRDAVKPGLGIK